MAWSPQARAAAIASRKAHAHGRRPSGGRPLSRGQKVKIAGAALAGAAYGRKTGRAGITHGAIAAVAAKSYYNNKNAKHPQIAMNGHHGNKVSRTLTKQQKYKVSHANKVAKITKKGKFQQYKKTGLVTPAVGHRSIHNFNKASRFNKAHGDKLKKYAAVGANHALLATGH